MLTQHLINTQHPFSINIYYLLLIQPNVLNHKNGDDDDAFNSAIDTIDMMSIDCPFYCLNAKNPVGSQSFDSSGPKLSSRNQSIVLYRWCKAPCKLCPSLV